MSAIGDVRRVVQDMVAPDLKSLHVELKAVEEASKLRDLAILTELKSLDDASKLRDDSLSDKMDRKFELLIAKIDANQAFLISAFNIDKRVEAIERKSAATM